MNDLLIGLVGALLATNQPAAVSNFVAQTTGISIYVPDPNDPVEREFKKLMEEDDAAQGEVDQWIEENNKFGENGAAAPPTEMKRRIRRRLDVVGKRYEDFIKAHPNFAKARVAYGSFLGDLNQEDEAQEQLEKALELNSKDPAVFNNLANIYGHHGPVKKAFEYYAKAIELNPFESVYYQNFGTTVYLFRVDAKEYYGIEEQQVFDKALELYSKAMKLDPTNFPLASDVAQTYYGIKPTRLDDALKAWTNALSIAHDDIEREGVYLHMARVKLHEGLFDEARGHINAVHHEMYAELKKRLARNLDEQEKEAADKSKTPETKPEEKSPEEQSQLPTLKSQGIPKPPSPKN